MIRRYDIVDIEPMLETIGEFLRSSPTYEGRSYEKDKIRQMLHNNVRSKGFHCDLALDDNGTILGGLCASHAEYIFNHDAYGFDLIFYITESKRSLKLATALVDSYVQWGKDRGLKEVRLASTTGIRPEQYNRLCEHLGFKQLGSIYTMEI